MAVRGSGANYDLQAVILRSDVQYCIYSGSDGIVNEDRLVFLTYFLDTGGIGSMSLCACGHVCSSDLIAYYRASRPCYTNVRL